MGIDIINNVVHVTDKHNKLLNINIKNKPVKKNIENLLVYSIFERYKSPRKSIGDSCPLLYALKEKHNLTTNIMSIKLLISNFYKILEKVPNNYDIIIPMPSNHKIVNVLTNKICKYNSSSQVLMEFFVKKRLIELEQEINCLSIDKKEKNILLNRLKLQKKEGNNTISLKSIPNNLRFYLNPLVVNNKTVILTNKRILLIDDLLSTGTTLKSAKILLESQYSTINIDALTLFSSI